MNVALRGRKLGPQLLIDRQVRRHKPGQNTHEIAFVHLYTTLKHTRQWSSADLHRLRQGSAVSPVFPSEIATLSWRIVR
jgi:hypothetical protein